MYWAGKGFNYFRPKIFVRNLKKSLILLDKKFILYHKLVFNLRGKTKLMCLLLITNTELTLVNKDYYTTSQYSTRNMTVKTKQNFTNGPNLDKTYIILKNRDLL
jgi:hypothetical protein